MVQRTPGVLPPEYPNRSVKKPVDIHIALTPGMVWLATQPRHAFSQDSLVIPVWFVSWPALLTFKWNTWWFIYDMDIYIYIFIHTYIHTQIHIHIHLHIHIHIHPGGPESEVVNYCFFQQSSFRLGENTIQRSQKLWNSEVWIWWFFRYMCISPRRNDFFASNKFRLPELSASVFLTSLAVWTPWLSPSFCT